MLAFSIALKPSLRVPPTAGSSDNRTGTSISADKLTSESLTACKALNDTHVVCLPNVFFVGASKCGTTTMSDVLLYHPRIRFVRRRIVAHGHHREVHRFDRDTYQYAINWIERLDAWASSPIVPRNQVPCTNNVPQSSIHVVHYTPHYLSN